MHTKSPTGEVSLRSAVPAAVVIALLTLLPAAMGQVTQVGRIGHFAITESSGLTASRRFPGVVWTHNDQSGNPFLFAMRQDGTNIRAFPVSGAHLVDWEDLGIDSRGNLYIADIGANGMARSHVAIHRVREPNPFGRVRAVRIERTWLLRFPGSREDCEAFFVTGGFGYLVSKSELGGTVNMYRFPLAARQRSIPLRRVSTVDVPGDVTGAAISIDASRLALLTDEGPVVYEVNGNIANIRDSIGYYRPFLNTFMEGAAFVGDGLLVTAETREILLFSEPPFQAR